MTKRLCIQGINDATFVQAKRVDGQWIFPTTVPEFFVQHMHLPPAHWHPHHGHHTVSPPIPEERRRGRAGYFAVTALAFIVLAVVAQGANLAYRAYVSHRAQYWEGKPYEPVRGLHEMDIVMVGSLVAGLAFAGMAACLGEFEGEN